MFTQASVHAFDMLGLVHISCEVRQTESPGQTPTAIVLQANTTVQGTGECDPREWLRDALVGMLEAL